MSFSRLPHELREAIVADLTEPDLVSFALVSKSALQLARPRIWRHLEFCFWNAEDHQDEMRGLRADLLDHWGNLSKEEREQRETGLEEAERAFAARTRRTRRVLTALERRPSLADLVQRIDFVGSNSMTLHCRGPQFLHFLASCRNLHTFTIEDGDRERLTTEISDALPSSVKELNFWVHPPPPEVFRRLLERLPVLASLLLCDMDPAYELDTLQRLCLPRLKDLSFYGSDCKPLVPPLTSAVPCLSSLLISLDSAAAVDRLCVAQLTRLSIEVHSSASSLPSSALFDLERLLRASVRLEYFRIQATWCSDSELEMLERHDVLGSLPPTLRTLEVSVNFGTRYILGFLHRRPLETRIRLLWSRFYLPPEEEQKEIEKACKERNVELEWRRGM